MPDPCRHPKNIIDAFYLIWENYPEPAMLVHKNEQVAAANPACSGQGHKIHCLSLDYGVTPKQNQELAGQALADQRPMFVKKRRKQAEITIYWMPVNGYPDYYIHFIAGSPEAENKQA